MSGSRASSTGYRISIVDEDPLRARREARELLSELVEVDSQAVLDAPAQNAVNGTDKGGAVTELLGLIFSGGSLAAAVVQIWLARVPQRTVVVTRSDGVELRINGAQARSDSELIMRFVGSGRSTGDVEGDGGATGSGAA